MIKQIEEYIKENLIGEAQTTALEFVAFLRSNNIDFCGHCGSCGGGKRKVVFGKEFPEVCGCTFRIDNPQLNELPFLRKH